MTMKKKGLGRGLSALLEDNVADLPVRAEAATWQPRPMDGITALAVSRIEPNPFQPRSTFSQEALAELAQSIRELGVIQPVTVRKVSTRRCTTPCMA